MVNKPELDDTLKVLFFVRVVFASTVLNVDHAFVADILKVSGDRLVASLAKWGFDDFPKYSQLLDDSFKILEGIQIINEPKFELTPPKNGRCVSEARIDARFRFVAAEEINWNWHFGGETPTEVEFASRTQLKIVHEGDPSKVH